MSAGAYILAVELAVRADLIDEGNARFFRELRQFLDGGRARGGAPVRLPAHAASCGWAAPAD